MSNLLLLIYAVISSTALIFIKLGTRVSGLITHIDNKVHLNLNLYVISGIFLYGVSFLLYTYMISKNELGYIIPISTALVYIFIFTASFVIFKETFTALKITGIALILGGLVLLNVNK